MSTVLLEWLASGHEVGLRVLERRIAAEMTALRACRTPAQRAEVEKRLRPLVVQRRKTLARVRERRAA